MDVQPQLAFNDSERVKSVRERREASKKMARSDLILSLVRAGAKGDHQLFRKSVEAIIAEERAKQHNVLADQLTDCLKANGASERPSLSSNGASSVDLFYEITPRRKLSDLVLSSLTSGACQELVEEQHRAELLMSHNV